MALTSIGDLARNFQLRRDSVEIRRELVRLTSEISTGRKSDLVGSLGGDFSQFASLETGIRRADSYLTIITERRLEVTSVQNALSEVRRLSEDVSGALIALPDLSDMTLVKSAGRDAEGRFASVLAALNTQVGGRSLFAGTASDAPAVADAETILAALEAEISTAGATTATAVEGVVETWFAAGGGYDTVGYLGSGAPITGVQLSDTEASRPQPTASDDAMRDVLSSLAMAALLGRGLLETTPDEATALAHRAGERLFEADRGMVMLQADVAGSETQIARAEVEVKAERDLLEIAKAELVGADPYDTAVQLEATEARLQTIYTITARLSDLSLSRYLR